MRDQTYPALEKPMFDTCGQLSFQRRRMNYLVALLEYEHPELRGDPAWDTLAGLAREFASDLAELGAFPS